MSKHKEKKFYGEEPIRQTLSGKELTLRPYDEKTDMDIFYKMFMKDKPFLRSLETRVRGKEFKREFLQGRTSIFTGLGEFSFIIERNSDKAVMGFIHLDNNYGYSHHVLTLSYYMGEQYRRKGYMEKALIMVIDCGFAGKLYQMDIEAHKNRRYLIYAFKAYVDIDNAPSNYLLNKLGFDSGGVEYCARSNDGWPIRDRVHRYVENPKHPLKRPYNLKEYGSYIFCAATDPKTGLAILPSYREWEY